MFFAAERELRGNIRRISEPMSEMLSVSSDMEISIGSPTRSRVRPRKSIDSVYPTFSEMSFKDIVQIADPDYVGDEDQKPAKRQRSAPACPLKRAEGLSVEPGTSDALPTKLALPTRYDSLDELIKTFPELQSMIAAQETRMSEARIPMEYVVDYVKPPPIESVKPSLPAASDPVSVFSSLTSTQTTPQASTASIFSSAVPSASAPEPANNGGGLLAGIDDLFGDSKKSKLKSKRR